MLETKNELKKREMAEVMSMEGEGHTCVNRLKSSILWLQIESLACVVKGALNIFAATGTLYVIYSVVNGKKGRCASCCPKIRFTRVVPEIFIAWSLKWLGVTNVALKLTTVFNLQSSSQL